MVIEPRVAEQELALANRWGAAHAVGPAQRQLGLVTDGERGEQLLRDAVTTLAESGACVEHAHALVDLGAALRRSNKRTDARACLREGVRVAEQIGAIGLAERANEEIAATGARPRKLLQTGIDALTASERRVAGLAAEGRSNKETAQLLFVTVKTVEVHLSSVYRKLVIESRGQLGAALIAASPTPAPDKDVARAQQVPAPDATHPRAP
jgi:DNA-binding CsgD family transcriptional regulator